MAEGWRLVERALRAGADVKSVLLSDRAAARPSADEARAIEAAVAAGVSLHSGSAEALSALIGGRTYGDLIARVSLRGELDVNEPALQRLLVGVDVLDPGNIGALWRTAHAMQVDAVLWVGGTDPLHPKSLRTSMGSCFRLPHAHWTMDSVAALERLSRAGWSNVAMATGGGSTRVAAARAALWLGGEAHGLPQGVVERADKVITIETAEDCDSLSINAAAAVGLHLIRAAQRDSKAT